MGDDALVDNTTGDGNTATGEALFGNTTGENNTATGYSALSLNTTGSRNIALGYQAGKNLTSGSSIHVYDVSGNLIESINGLNFSDAFNVIAAHIALNPGKRVGFVDGPDIASGQIQSFTY
jgi:hypothetical protein